MSTTFDPAQAPPLLTADLPGIGGRIKAQPEDFEVEEIPAYPPSGSGDFLYLWVEKRDMGAEYFVRQVARRLDVPVGEVGTAGLKDRRAVTRQMVSVPARAESRQAQLDGDGWLRQVLPGDVMAKWPFGGMFVAEDVPREQARFDARETVTAGPMFGRKMFAAAGEAAAREAAVLQDAKLTAESFHGFGKLLS